MSGRHDDELQRRIDALYQLPPEQFVPARNALAREVGGGDAALVKSLRRPTPCAWLVNQLFWTEPEVIGRVRSTADALRKAMKAASAGQPSDLRAASTTHRQATDRALQRVLAMARKTGHDPSPALRREILHTLQAFPGDEPPGRLTRPLAPPGFEVLEESGFRVASETVAGKPPNPSAGATRARLTRKTAGAALGVARGAARHAQAVVRTASTARQGARVTLKRARTVTQQAHQASSRAQKAAQRATESMERARKSAQQAREALEAAQKSERLAQEALEQAQRILMERKRAAHEAAAALRLETETLRRSKRAPRS